ncbi:MAG: hypothetical protein IPM97_00815 [Bdellovibrionaceae bacterium]|nr:hypothetical protein [Pseudobdellovibrionaceae bacterium]
MKKLIFNLIVLSILSQKSNAVDLQTKTILCTDSAIETMNVVNDVVYVGGGFSRVGKCLHSSSEVGPATVDTQTGKLTNLYLSIPTNYQYLHIVDFKGDYDGVILQGVLNGHSYLIGIENSGQIDFTIDTSFVDSSLTGYRKVYIDNAYLLVRGSEQIGIFDRKSNAFLSLSQDIKVLKDGLIFASKNEVILGGYFSLQNQKYNF